MTHPNPLASALEAAIEHEYEEMLAADNETDGRKHFNRMVALMRQRSPQRVAEMERAQGLK